MGTTSQRCTVASIKTCASDLQTSHHKICCCTLLPLRRWLESNSPRLAALSAAVTPRPTAKPPGGGADPGRASVPVRGLQARRPQRRRHAVRRRAGGAVGHGAKQVCSARKALALSKTGHRCSSPLVEKTGVTRLTWPLPPCGAAAHALVPLTCRSRCVVQPLGEAATRLAAGRGRARRHDGGGLPGSVGVPDCAAAAARAGARAVPGLRRRPRGAVPRQPHAARRAARQGRRPDAQSVPGRLGTQLCA